MRLDEIKALPKFDTAYRRRVERMPSQDLLDRERAAVDWYTNYGYIHVNALLRGISPDGELSADDDGLIMEPEEALDHLDRVLAGAPRRPRAITVFRGERNPSRAADLDAMQIGESFVDPGYLSTSFGPSYAFYAFARHAGAPDCLSMIVVPPSVRGALIGVDKTERSRELEFLIDRGTRYTLTDKRTIPNSNRGHPVKAVRLLVWRASR